MGAMAGGLDPKDVSAILSAWGEGDPVAGDELIAIVYQELRRLAAYYLQSECINHTLQPTALVHELYLKLFSAGPLQLKDRDHFLALAARQLRRIVVDHARNKHALKRGGLQEAISLDDVYGDAHGPSVPADDRVVDLDLALERLQTLDPRAAQVVELRYFGGLTEEESARALNISSTTVKRDWDFARSWLLSQLK
jgi:RNA polymerase sigma-70 factor (ECF subfamily)